jgi:hypothetical protein
MNVSGEQARRTAHISGWGALYWMLVACALGFAACAHGQSFDLLSESRSVSGNAEIVIIGQNAEPATDTETFLVEPPQAFGDFLETGNLAMDLAAPDGTASAHADVLALQDSAMGSEFIQFEGATHAFGTVMGEALPGSFVLTSARSFMEVAFDVHRGRPAVLRVDTSPFFPSTHFGFELSRDGNVVWDVVEMRDPDTGELILSFEVPLQLVPGHYEFKAEMVALNRTAGNDGGQISGSVSLVAIIPEPQTWLLMAAGIVILGVAVRRSRRPVPALA